MKKIFAIALLTVSSLASAEIVLPIPSPRNMSGVVFGMGLTPLNAALIPITALAQDWPAGDGIADVTNFVFPASTVPYTFAGVMAEVLPRGPGFKTRQSLLLDYVLPTPESVPAGVTVLVTVNAPSIGQGSVVVNLGPLPPPPPVPTYSADCTKVPPSVSIKDAVGAIWTSGPRSASDATVDQVSIFRTFGGKTDKPFGGAEYAFILKGQVCVADFKSGPGVLCDNSGSWLFVAGKAAC